MIQRIQTIFLVLVALTMGVSASLPYWEETSSLPDKGEKVHIGTLNSLELQHVVKTAEGQQVVQQKNTVSILVLCLVAALLSIYIIFQYNKRMLQVKLSALNTLVIGGAAAAMLYYSYMGDEWIAPDSRGQMLFGIYLPPMAVVFNMLSRHFIMKDEKLVRSADRIR